MKPPFLKALLFLGAVGASTTVALFLLTRPSNREIAHWPSPDGHYHLILMAGDTDWRGFPFSTPPHYFFYAGRDSHEPSYGHSIEYGLHPAMAGFFDEDLAAYVRKATVTWSAEGISFDEPSGHRLLIPRRAYEGGR